MKILSSVNISTITRGCAAVFSCRFCATVAEAAVVFLLALAVVFSGVFSLVLPDKQAAALAATPDSEEAPGYLNMPWEYGEVIYRINPQSSKQLYIIGISHRDPASGGNGPTTVKAQQEIYRIGEWLKKQTNSDLLLPEGYFNDEVCTAGADRSDDAAGAAFAGVVDPARLERELTAEKFTNAEMLLMRHLNFSACQVEDKSLYGAVRKSLAGLSGSAGGKTDFRRALAEIGRLQEVRTAQLLQDIPGIIDDQFSYGAIGRRSAIFTIGLNHIKHIFRFLESGSIEIDSPAPAGSDSSLEQSPLNLLTSGYGISIILPRSLAENPQLLEKTQIARILLASGNV